MGLDVEWRSQLSAVAVAPGSVMRLRRGLVATAFKR